MSSSKCEEMSVDGPNIIKTGAGATRYIVELTGESDEDEVVVVDDGPNKVQESVVGTKKECGTNTGVGDQGNKQKVETEAEVIVEEEIDTAENRSRDAPQVNLFTCYIGPCREDRNLDFTHPEFMICYKDPNSSPTYDNSMVRYFCCPLFIATVERDGKTDYELRTLPPQNQNQNQNQQRTTTNENRMPNGAEDWRTYYQQHASYSDYGSQQHQQQHPWNFLYHYCCSCPAQMMAHYLHCQGHQQQGHPQQQQQQHHRCPMPNFGYQQNYSFPGSAMG